MLLISLFIFAFGVFENDEKTYKKNINIYILLFNILLISVVFYIGRPDIKFYKWWFPGQYEPFHTITSQLNYGSTLEILKNIIGNSVMLIPLSLLLMIKDEKYNNILRQMKIILPLIISIEIFQAATHIGAFDIDDILLNCLGTIIFTFLITRFSIIKFIRSMFYTDYKFANAFKYFFVGVTLFLLVIYIILIYFKIF